MFRNRLTDGSEPQKNTLTQNETQPNGVVTRAALMLNSLSIKDLSSSPASSNHSADKNEDKQPSGRSSVDSNASDRGSHHSTQSDDSDAEWDKAELSDSEDEGKNRASASKKSMKVK